MLMLPKDLKIEYYKSSGPGGQHKNKRSCAVRVTHLPTGLVAIAEEERSQAQNKLRALERLSAKVRERLRVRKKRLATRKTRASRERVLAWKKRHGLQKSLRREGFGQE